MADFAAFSLRALSPLHLGRRRAGIVAETWRHAPGHLFVYALAAAVGAARGGSPEHFASALDEIVTRFRFGPAFIFDGERRLDEAEIERRCVTASDHVALDVGSRSAVESALFEVEALTLPPDLRLKGGVWFERGDKLDGVPLAEWLGRIRLGGELKVGFGRITCDTWKPAAKAYPGIGSADAKGVHLLTGEVLPGAALDGVSGAPLVPLLGRRHDPVLGFGRRLSAAALVRFNGRVQQAGHFLPASVEPGLACWQPAVAS